MRFIDEDPELAGTILQNDAETTRLDTYMPDGWNEIAWRRPGNMLGQNTKVTMLDLIYGYEYFASLANGLQHNRTIENFEVGAYDLCTILAGNTSLKEMFINFYRIGEDTMIAKSILWC